VGIGFGFSYRNDPKFIRIDNQFFDQKTFQVIDFQTHKDIRYSDHFPVFGIYRFMK
jgi:exonuclease III